MDSSFELSIKQKELVNLPVEGSLFLKGPAGAGKTTTASARMLHLAQNGLPMQRLLVLVPQRTLGQPYHALRSNPAFPGGGQPEIVTIGGIARRALELFWPEFSEQAGFARPDNPPTFLTMETAQYYMAQIVEPLIEQGYFSAITIERYRLYSQILDNLNKAAAIGIPYASFSDRLIKALGGDTAQQNAFHEAQECASRFRSFCIQNNLLDFSLQLEVFGKLVLHSETWRESFLRQFSVLIYDNVEEDIPLAHDLIREIQPSFRNAWFIYDTEAGYRSFLGADPIDAAGMSALCQRVEELDHSWVNNPGLAQFQTSLRKGLFRQPLQESTGTEPSASLSLFRFLPQAVEDVGSRIGQLVHEKGVSPGRIVVISPFLSDALRFSLANQLEKFSIPTQSHRPSRGLNDEPAIRCMLALAKIAHPAWGMECAQIEFRSALFKSLEGIDLNRADLLARIVFQNGKKQGAVISSFSQIRPDMQERITYSLGERFEALKDWIANYIDDEPVELDVFLSRLFGELLSQPGFGFHGNFDDAAAASRLIESLRKFRRVVASDRSDSFSSIGLEFIKQVEAGVISAQYLEPWFSETDKAVFLSPAYTFLLRNKPVDFQFWLDINSMGWWERLYQPLTHPFVLSRQWDLNAAWSDELQLHSNQETLERITIGLLRRCREKVFLYSIGINEQGEEQRGPLLQAVQFILRRNPGLIEVESV